MNVLKYLLLLFFFSINLWARPNVLFIAVDDLRDWVGHLNSIPKYSLQKTKLAKWLPSTNGEPKK